MFVFIKARQDHKNKNNNNIFMEKPQIIIDSIQVNIKAPQELHIVRPHSARKSSYGSQHEIPQTIKEQNPIKETDETFGSSHKIKHLQSLQDKGEFIDQTSHSRISQKDQARETITRTIHPEPQLPLEDADLQKITEQIVNEEENSKPLKHINVGNLIDRDQFNLKNSRQKNTQNRRRRFSETNVKGYGKEKMTFGNGNGRQEIHRSIVQKVIEQQAQPKTRLEQDSTQKRRKSSLHSSHQGFSEQIRRMIVDELDRKKKVKFDEKNDEQNDEPEMQAIKEQKQQDENVHVSHLQKARQRIEEQLESLSKVVGSQIGPLQNGQHQYMQKTQPIKEQAKEEKQQ